MASPLEDTAVFAPEPRFPHTIPQHCPASSTPKEPGQLHNAVSPATLTFQSIRDAPKIQHGLGASLNPKEREQSSCSVSTIHAWEGKEQGTIVGLGSLSMHGAGLKPRSSGRCKPECNIGAVIWDQPQKCLSRGLKHHQNHGTQPQRCGEPDFPCLKQILTGNITAAPDPGEAAPALPGVPGRGEGKKMGLNGTF